jgi:hypothetical protein
MPSQLLDLAWIVSTGEQIGENLINFLFQQNSKDNCQV